MKTLIGSIAALPTPFKNGAFDAESYRALIADLLENGADGLVPIGTTGEASTLSAEEQSLVIRTAVEAAKGRAPVIAGAGTFSTATTIEAMRRARDAGADGVLIVTPYYTKPTQEGLFAHYKAAAQAHPKFPIVLYNVPGRTAVDLLPDTCRRLCDIPEIVAIKEASGSLSRLIELIEKCGERLVMLTGDDFNVAPFIASGGKGVISVSANAVPRMMADLVHAALKGDLKKAMELQIRLNPLHRALFLEANPIPLKAALNMMGKYGPEMRLPLTPMSDSPRAKLKEALAALGMLS